MSGWQYLAWVIEGLALLVVCGIGLAFMGSLARQAWKDTAAWVRKVCALRALEKSIARGFDLPLPMLRKCSRYRRQALRRDARVAQHIMRQVRQGKLDL